MNRSIRFSTALSAIAVAAVITGCASGRHRGGSELSQGTASSKVGLSMRALAALDKQDFASAVGLAEQAVEHQPGEPTVRKLLGNAYFASGRFASAEAAFRDSLSLDQAQPKVVLKLALAQIAQGKNAQAIALLESARNMLDASDYGLAIALAGQPVDAVAVLGQAARRPGADARVRQNLALAYGLSGDWENARVIAAQDVPANLVDARVQQWMAIAQPQRASDQVAAIVGVTPAIDPGQPVRLALHRDSEPAVLYAQQSPGTANLPQVQRSVSLPLAVPAAPVAVEAQAPLPPLPEMAALPKLPAVAETQAAASKAEPVQQVAQALFQTAATPIAPLPTEFKEERSAASKVPVTARPERPERASGKSNSVVQLGAYGSPERVAVAWDQLSRRYPALNRYRPVSARFDSPKGTFYRLAVKGFASSGDAQDMCEALQAKGKKCFVRRVAGDAPVQIASR